ncbi:PREDICTED: trypsin II-P29-like [Ceratosolen solmsi marchali]|uniref:Trypsin II-P29-like n=1 Tax=Ceratosolen solmsi marchali TaxID=326594 RepID=A0AAJ6YG07_9HYME|nr:PREDICTED: trypsin II-P29-like [Ceratosolen solmsi marchali]
MVFAWDHPHDAGLGQFPHQVSLVWSLPPDVNNFHYCGGSILSNLWVLTSAFCVTNIYMGNLLIKVGRHNIIVDDEYVQTSHIQTQIIHPKYQGVYVLENLGSFDLALLKLIEPLEFNRRVQPIELPNSGAWFWNSFKFNYNLILSGWGGISNGVIYNHTKILQTVHLPVVPNKVCSTSIKTIYPHFTLDDSQMCTRPMDGSISACIGDYGGPLIQYDKTNRPVLVAVYAWSTMPCNTNGLPPIYTRIFPFAKWIKKTMKEN